jgi:hypothetical protein
MKQSRQRHEQKSIAFVAMVLFMLMLLLIQMWLFTSTLEALIDGKAETLVPAAAVSVGCLIINIWILVGLTRMEHNP